MGKKGAVLSMILLSGGFLIGILMMIVVNWIKTDEMKSQLLKEKEAKSIISKDTIRIERGIKKKKGDSH